MSDITPSQQSIGSSPKVTWGECTARHTCETPTRELPDHLRVQPVVRLGSDPAGRGRAGPRGRKGVEAHGVALVLAVGEEEAC